MVHLSAANLFGPGDSAALNGGFKLLVAAAALPSAVSGLWVAVLAALPPAPVYAGLLALSFLLAVQGLAMVTAGVLAGTSPAPMPRMTPVLVLTWIVALLPSFVLGALAGAVGNVVAAIAPTGREWLVLAGSAAGAWLLFLAAAVGGVVFAALRTGPERVPFWRAAARTAAAMVRKPAITAGAAGFLLLAAILSIGVSGFLGAAARLTVASPTLRLEIDTGIQSLCAAVTLAGFVSIAARMVARPRIGPDETEQDHAPDESGKNGERAGRGAERVGADLRALTLPVVVMLVAVLAVAPFAPSFALVPYASRAAGGLAGAVQSLDAGDYGQAVALARRSIAAADSELACIALSGCSGPGTGTVNKLLNRALYADPGSPDESFVRAMAAAVAGDRKTALAAARGAVDCGNPEGYLVMARYAPGPGARRRMLGKALLGAPLLPLYAPSIPPAAPFDGFVSQARIAGEIEGAAVSTAVYAAAQPLAANDPAGAFLLARPLDWVIGSGSAAYPQFMTVMGQIRWELQDPDAAAGDFAAAVESAPEDSPWRARAEAWLLRALCLPQVNPGNSDARNDIDFGGAARTALADGERAGSPPGLRLAAGEYLIARRQWARAEETLALVTGPDQATALAETALACYENHDAAGAESAAKWALNDRPSDDARVVAYNVLGGLASDRGRAGAAEAIADFRHVVELRPYAFIAWINLGNEYTLTGQNGFAAEAYNNALVALYAPQNQGPTASVTGNPGENGGEWSPGGDEALADELRADIRNALHGGPQGG